MTSLWKNLKFFFIIASTLLCFSNCATFFDDFDKKILENKEFDQQVQIKEISEPEAVGLPKTSESSNKDVLIAKEKKTEPLIKDSALKKKSEKNKKSTESKSVSVVHEPSIEDSEGFIGRRPQVDPFIVGEESEFSLSYFAVEAGKFKMSIKPFVEVNGRKAYHFSYAANSSSVFSVFYSVDDKAETYVDYELLVPYSYSISAKESKQIRDVKSYSDWKKMKAKTWDKKIKKGKDPEIKNYEWDIDPYAQNVFTVAFYLRCFTLAVGKKLAVNVAHEGKNIIMRAEIVREEKLNTRLGKIDTFVVKPSFEIDGVFKPVGDVYLWVTKDNRKRLVRIESKIKIGKIVASIEKMSP